MKPSARMRPISLSVSVDLPAPGRAGDADGPRAAGLGMQARDRDARAGAALLDEREHLRNRAPVAGQRPLHERGGIGGHGAEATRLYSSVVTSVTPGTRSMMIRSTPAFRVIIETGQVPHAPTSVTCTTPSSSTVAEDDVAAVALQRGPDHLDGLENALFHAGGVERHGAPQLRGSGRGEGIGANASNKNTPSIAPVPREAPRRGFLGLNPGARRRRRGRAGCRGGRGSPGRRARRRTRSSRRRRRDRRAPAPRRPVRRRRVTGAPDRRSTPRTIACRPSVRTSAPMRASSSTNWKRPS